MAFFQSIPDMFSGQPLPHAEYASDSLLELTRKNVAVSKLDDQALSFFRTNGGAAWRLSATWSSRGSGFLAGCDGLVPGFCLHDELEWMTKAGLSPLQALQTATINPARVLWTREHAGHDRRRQACRPGAARSRPVDGHPQHTPHQRRARTRPASVEARHRPHPCGSQALTSISWQRRVTVSTPLRIPGCESFARPRGSRRRARRLLPARRDA